MPLIIFECIFFFYFTFINNLRFTIETNSFTIHIKYYSREKLNEVASINLFCVDTQLPVWACSCIKNVLKLWLLRRKPRQTSLSPYTIKTFLCPLSSSLQSDRYLSKVLSFLVSREKKPILFDIGWRKRRRVTKLALSRKLTLRAKVCELYC